jgi:hypothetical protein
MTDTKKIKVSGPDLLILPQGMSFKLLPDSGHMPIQARRISKSEIAAITLDQFPNAETKKANSKRNKQNPERLIVSGMSRHFVSLIAIYNFLKRMVYPLSSSNQKATQGNQDYGVIAHLERGSQGDDQDHK